MGAERIGFRHIVLRIGDQDGGIVVPLPRNLLPRNVGASLCGKAEVDGGLLEAVALHIPLHRVVALDQEKSVDDMPSRNFGPGVFEGMFRKSRSCLECARDAPVPPE